MSTDAIDDPVEELLRQDLAEARRQERDGHRHQVDPYSAAQLKQEAWEAWRTKYLDCGGHDEYRKVVGL